MWHAGSDQGQIAHRAMPGSCEPTELRPGGIQPMPRVDSKHCSPGSKPVLKCGPHELLKAEKELTRRGGGGEPT